MFAQLINNDFYFFDGINFHRLLTRDQLNNDNVVAVLPFGEEYLLVTSKSGLYLYSETNQRLRPWRTSLDEELQESVINRAILSGDEQLIFGTLNSGLFAIDNKGKKLWHINRNNGLNNNTVLSLFSDRDYNLWVALDNGIAHIRSRSPLSFFEPTDMQLGLVEDILHFQNTLYLATNQGIYSYSEADEKFFRIPGFENQSWFINSFGNQLFVGHNLGTSILENGSAKAVPNAQTGGMNMK
jgi:ligand-binding sensor domain-containing protein